MIIIPFSTTRSMLGPVMRSDGYKHVLAEIQRQCVTEAAILAAARSLKPGASWYVSQANIRR